MTKEFSFYFITFVIVIISSRTVEVDQDNPIRIKDLHHWKYVSKEYVLTANKSVMLFEDLITSVTKNPHYHYRSDDDHDNQVYDYDYIKNNQFRSAMETRMLKYICLMYEYADRLKEYNKRADQANTKLHFLVSEACTFFITCRDVYSWPKHPTERSEFLTKINKIGDVNYENIIEFTKKNFLELLYRIPFPRAEPESKHLPSDENSKTALENDDGSVKEFPDSPNIENEITHRKNLYDSLTNSCLCVDFVFDKNVRFDALFDYMKQLDFDVFKEIFFK